MNNQMHPSNLLNIIFVFRQMKWEVIYDVSTKEFFWPDDLNMKKNEDTLSEKEKSDMEHKLVKYMKLHTINMICVN